MDATYSVEEGSAYVAEVTGFVEGNCGDVVCGIGVGSHVGH